MNDFLDAMARSLRHMSAQEKQDILRDYKEHFEAGIDSGKTEAQIANELGDPGKLAKMFTAVSANETVMISGGSKNILRMLGALISYKVGGGLLMGMIYFCGLSVLGCLFATAGGLVLAGLGCVVVAAITFAAGGIGYGFAEVFAALLLGCAGLLGIIYTARLSKITIPRLPHLARRIMNADSQKEAE